MKIAIGSDHGGYELKEHLKRYIAQLGHECVDLGTFSSKRCDYPDYAFLVAKNVAAGACDFGIMIDAAGIGSSIVANKLPGVRAAVANEIYTARNSRAHNNANVLCLGSLVVGRGVAEQIVEVWLSTQFGGERNQKRVNRISELEKMLFRP